MRILAFLILLISILAFPLWVSAILALLGMMYFYFFIEAVILFLISDLLYGVPELKFFNIVFVSFFASLVIFIILKLLKKKLRFK